MSYSTGPIRNIRQLIHYFRIALLRKRGLKIGRNVYIDYDVRFDGGYPFLITIGDDCTITHGVKILAHDASMNRHVKHAKIGCVTIGRKTFIGYDVILLPNIRIGKNVVIGAGSIVTTDIPDDSVAVGCPAKVIDTTENFIRKHEEYLTSHPFFNEKVVKSWTKGENV